MTTPAWSAPQNGFPGNLNSTNASAQVNQGLGAHSSNVIYDGTIVVASTEALFGFAWFTLGSNVDLGQIFTMSGTSISRVLIPVKPIGNGADMLVTLCPDSGGSPNTAAPIVSTMVPAAAINQLAAPAGLTVGAGPLANEDSNTGRVSGFTRFPWPAQAVDAGGPSITFSTATSGNYFINAGGTGSSGLLPNSALVTTAQYVGGGVLNLPVPQPSLPVATNTLVVAVVNGTVVCAGGNTSNSTDVPTGAVFTATWDINTGTVGAWSVQASIPTPTDQASGVGYGSYVYFVGGLTAVGPVLTANVWYANVNNGQITSWIAGPPLPVALSGAMVVALNGWLVVMGGGDVTQTPVNTVYYAPINADGSLGAWQTGPPLPIPVQSLSSGQGYAVAGDLVFIWGGITTAGGGGITRVIQTITVTATGLSEDWRQSWWFADYYVVGAFDNGDGTFDVAILDVNSFPLNSYQFTTIDSVPYLSVPLPATGLTNGGSYHIVLQQNQNADSSSYLQWGLDSDVSPDAQTSARHSGTWSTTVTIGQSVPLAIYNNVARSASVKHIADDPNIYNVTQRWSTLLYNNQNLPIGAIDVTMNPNNPLNSNPTFTTNVTNWTPTGGTFVQSAAQTHGGFPFSGLLTPNGVTATVTVNSEFVPVSTGGGPFYGLLWYLLDGWFYSPTGYASFSPSVNWYDSSKTYLTTTNHTTTLAAATWTHVQAYYQAPASASFAKISIIEGGTPTSSNTVFLSNVFLVLSPECVGSTTSAATVNYGTTSYPPVGTTQLL